MAGLKRIPTYLVMLVALIGLTSCSTTYTIYGQDMFQGKNFLAEEEYEQARGDFLKAYQTLKNPDALVFAATASYKLNDLPAAEGYISDAEQSIKETSLYCLRMLGYKALILLKDLKRQEGMEALKVYLDNYRHLYPLTTINEVEKMMKQEKINMTLLEKLIDEQVKVYEDEVTQYLETNTGFLARFSGGRVRMRP